MLFRSVSGLHDPGTPEARDLARKSFSDRAALAAMNGLALWRSDAADGPQRYFLARNGLVRLCADAVEVDRLLEQAGSR